MELEEGKDIIESTEKDEKYSKMLEQIGEGNDENKKEKKKKNRKSELNPEITEVREEGECNADFGEKLKLADLLNPLEKHQDQTVDQHIVSSGKIKKDIQRIVKNTAQVHKPLAKLIRDRVEREVSYKKSQAEMTKWVAQIKQNREADCIEYTQDVNVDVNLASLAASHPEKKPKSKLEQDIFAALQKQGIDTEEQIKEKEQKVLNTMSTTEIKERVAQLAKMKRLMLSEEIKNKRIAKIKSKLYHKIKRKNKEKEEKLLLEQLEQIDPETADKVKLKQEEKRVDERMRMRHSTKSKYARNLIRFAGLESQNTKEGLQELIRTRDEIKRKPIEKAAKGKDEDEISEKESSDSEGSEKLPEEVEEEKNEIKIDFSEATKGKPQTKSQEEKDSGLFALKFMKDAEKREEEQFKQHINFVKEQLINEVSDDEKPEEEQEEKNEEKAEGRMKKDAAKERQYSLKKLPEKIQAITKEATYDEWTTKPKSDKQVTHKELIMESNDEVLEEIGEQINKKPLKISETIIENIEQEDEATKDLIKKAITVAASVLFKQYKEKQNEEDFKKEKEEEVMKNVKLESGPLAGWGSWAGPDIKKKKIDPEELKRKRFEKLKEEKQKRKDGTLDNVIINEQRDKQFTKYKVDQLPYPYHSIKEYEMTQDVAIGNEWNTMCTYKRMIQPEDIIKKGRIIKPIKYVKDIPTETVEALVAMRKKPARPPAKF